MVTFATCNVFSFANNIPKKLRIILVWTMSLEDLDLLFFHSNCRHAIKYSLSHCQWNLHNFDIICILIFQRHSLLIVSLFPLVAIVYYVNNDNNNKYKRCDLQIAMLVHLGLMKVMKLPTNIFHDKLLSSLQKGFNNNSMIKMLI